MTCRFMRIIMLVTALLVMPLENAYAVINCPTGVSGYSALRCNDASVCPGTTLYDESANSGACQNTGMDKIFGTVICRFVQMVNRVLDAFFCSINYAAQPTLKIVAVLFVMLYGVQMVMGTAQLNSRELVPRILKLSVIFWLTTNSQFGVSASINTLFGFFLGFITQVTHLMMDVLGSKVHDLDPDIVMNNGGSYDIYPTFDFIDQWIHNAFFAPANTGDPNWAQQNEKLIGFFIAMAIAMPPLAIMAVYWLMSLAMVLVRTLIAFLTSLVAVAFLLALSPIFLSLMLFKVTYQFFDTWLRFMMSFCIQVLVAFAVLTIWIYSMTLFLPFFQDLTSIIFVYTAANENQPSEVAPQDTWGLCPYVIDNVPGELKPTDAPVSNPTFEHIKCVDANFNPIPDPAIMAGNNVADAATEKDRAAQDHAKEIPPSQIPNLSRFIFYMYYHLVTLVVVSYGFASLQKNAQQVAKDLGGNPVTPVLNGDGFGNRTFGEVAGEGKAGMNKFMQERKFNIFSNRHESTGGVMDKISQAVTFVDQSKDVISRRR